LTKVSQEDLGNIRRLHQGGVSLLAFENVRGLEDLFGVREDDARQVCSISVNDNLADNPISTLAGLTEHTVHRACKGMYRAAGADVLLDGEVPVLFARKTRWGKTALFNIPPTAVRRQSQFNRVCYGRDNISELVNESAKLVLRHLGNPAVETDAGKVIGFTDTKGDRHVIVEEDAHPMPARAIRPLVTLRMPGIKREKISCDKDFSIVSIGRGSARIRLSLGPDEFAVITVRK